jgi:hypothetical protein
MRDPLRGRPQLLSVTRAAVRATPARNEAVSSAARAAALALESLAVAATVPIVEPTFLPEPVVVQEAAVGEVIPFPGPSPVATLAPDAGVTRVPQRRGLRAVLVATAIALAGVSGWYSTTGLTAIFVGAFWPVIVLGIVLEAGKLATASALPLLPWGPLKIALSTLVAALMMLNIIGCFGFLSKAQITHTFTTEADLTTHTAQVQARVEVAAATVADYDQRIAQIDGAVVATTQRGHTKSAMALAGDQRATRAQLVTERQRAAEAVANLKAEAAQLSAQRQVAAADLGPVRYLAVLIGAPADGLLRLFILLVSCLLDPAAVLLLVAASSERR